MSNVYFIGDLHIDHKNAIRFRPQFKTIEEHDDYICNRWEARVTKNDVVYVLGDVAFSVEALDRVGHLPGRKILIRGNHDTFPLLRYALYFEEVYGLYTKKFSGVYAWLSHAPIHPKELRNRINIHGHVHSNTLEDRINYWNVSCEAIDYEPVTIKQLEMKAMMYATTERDE